MTLNSVSEVTAVENIYFKEHIFFLNTGNCIGCRYIEFQRRIKTHTIALLDLCTCIS